MTEKEKAEIALQWLSIFELIVTKESSYALGKAHLESSLLSAIRKYRRISEEIICPTPEKPKLSRKPYTKRINTPT